MGRRQFLFTAAALATQWTSARRDAVANLFSQASGVDLSAQKRSVDRAGFGLSPMTDQIIAEQQAVADRFARLGLNPAPIAVRDIA